MTPIAIDVLDPERGSAPDSQAGSPGKCSDSLAGVTGASDSRLRETLENTRRLLQAFPMATLVVDARGYVIEANAHAETLFGYASGDMIGLGVEALIPTRFRDHHATARRDSVLGDATHRAMRGDAYTALHRNGREFPVEVGLGRIASGDEACVVVSIIDISERLRAEGELRVAAIAFESQAGMLVTDPHGVIIRVNRAFTRLTGYRPEEAIGKTPALLRSGRHDADYYRRMWADLKANGYWQGEVWNRRKNGKVYAEWLTISAVSAPNGQISHYVGTFSDITVNKGAEAEIHRLAYYDPLTHLPNRHLLQDRLAQALAGSARSGRHGALLFLDLDHFKSLNDTRGHAIGDQLLVEVARRLHGVVREGDTVSRLGDNEGTGSRPGDTVSRLGGDEFVVVLEDLSDDIVAASLQARVVGEKLREVLAHPYDLADAEYYCTASLGIALFRGHDVKVETLLRQADLALYQAKDAGRNTLRFFDPAMQARLDERIDLESDLRKALKRNQLRVHYQAQVDYAGRIVGAEALLRWTHPQRGAVPPAVFIPLAEDTGLIVPIGHWVLATACKQLQDWSGIVATRELRLAVNVSARQFRQPNFVDEVRELLNDTGIDPGKLKIELTESVVIDDVAKTITRMHELKALGVGFSMDDFGTGYSSLSYLKRLPLDQLKIDSSFVNDIASDPNDAAIVKTIISMGRTLGLSVVAEGVETEAQRRYLEAHGCHIYQGYFFARPLPLAEFEDLLKHAGR